MLYTVLIYGVDGVFDRLPADEQEAHTQVHRDLQEKLTANGTFRSAIRLMPPSTAMSVKGQGDRVVVTDGPYAETKEQLLGFYLIETDTLEETLEAARDLCQGIANMEVRPVNWFGQASTD